MKTAIVDVTATVLKLKRIKGDLAKTRDELRDMEDEIETLREIGDDTVEQLQYVIDRLSERV